MTLRSKLIDRCLALSCQLVLFLLLAMLWTCKVCCITGSQGTSFIGAGNLSILPVQGCTQTYHLFKDAKACHPPSPLPNPQHPLSLICIYWIEHAPPTWDLYLYLFISIYIYNWLQPLYCTLLLTVRTG